MSADDKRLFEDATWVSAESAGNTDLVRRIRETAEHRLIVNAWKTGFYVSDVEWREAPEPGITTFYVRATGLRRPNAGQ